MSTASWHIITSEYPPDLGGVADFAEVLASVLPGEVHVWTAGTAGEEGNIHRVMGDFGPAELRRAGRSLDVTRSPRTLLVQWVPHGFGRRSMNVAFCLWVWRRAKFRGDRVELLVHEPFLSQTSNVRQWLVVATHRLMVTILLRAATKVYLSTPSWIGAIRPWAFGRELGFEAFPLPSNIAVRHDPAEVLAVRERFAGEARHIVGHFGACGGPVLPMLLRAIPPLLRSRPDTVVLLIGRESSSARAAMIESDPSIASRLHATGPLPAAEVSIHLQACDLLVQPYPDGVTTRRTSVMAALRHGAPVLTTEGHLTEEFWSAEDAVLLVAAADSDAFVEEAVALLDDPARRTEIGRRGQRLYDARFDMKRLAGFFGSK